MTDYKKNIPFRMRFIYGTYQVAYQLFGFDSFKKINSKGIEKFENKLHKVLKESGKGKEIPVERRTDLSYEEFKKEYLDKGKPVIFAGGAKEWDSVKKWSLDYIKELHGDDMVTSLDEETIKNPTHKQKLSDIIDGIREGKGYYFRFYPLLSEHPEHRKEFDENWLKKHRNKFSLSGVFQVFMGGDRSYTSLHNASQGNLFVQTFGQKKWVIYPPYYTAIVDPLPVNNIYREASFERSGDTEFNHFRPDYTIKGFKNYEFIDKYTATLEPGDVLWNPPFYWHAVENNGDSIGVGYRWMAPFHAFKMARLYMFLELFGTTPPIWKSYKLYKKDVNLLRLEEYTMEKKRYIRKVKLANLFRKEKIDLTDLN